MCPLRGHSENGCLSLRSVAPDAVRLILHACFIAPVDLRLFFLGSPGDFQIVVLQPLFDRLRVCPLDRLRGMKPQRFRYSRTVLKDLSVNSNDFPPADDRCRKTDKGFIALDQLLVSDKQLPEAVEPGVCCLDDPASVLGRPAAFSFLLGDPGNVPPRPDLLVSGLSAVSLIRIQEPLPFGKRNNDRVENCGKLTDIMTIRPGNDQRQRDAMPVHEDMALASLFFPGLSDSDRWHLVRGVL